MKRWIFSMLVAVFSATSFAGQQLNQDIDIFMSNPVVSSSTAAPNVLIVLDNTANWNKPFSAEKSALKALMDLFSNSDWDGKFNVGLMMFSETGTDSVTKEKNDNVDGGYVRFAIRNMSKNSGNIDKLNNLVNSLDQGADVSNGGKVGMTMQEAYRYFSGKLAFSGLKVKRDYLAFDPSDKTGVNYKSPESGICQKSYIIFISNGKPQDNDSDTTTATDILKNFGGSANTILLSPNNSESNIGDEWARFMSLVDLQPNADGLQNILTYTIEVNPDSKTAPGLGITALLKSMGTGGYVGIKDGFDNTNLTKALTDALTDTFSHILSVNSVFTSAAVTNSVNNYGTNLDQVYVGMFRTDADAKPRWHGNLKLYKLYYNGSKYVYTGKSRDIYSDADPVGPEVIGSNGQVSDSAKSFWSTSSNFWTSPPYSTAERTPGGDSDIPDGSLTIKGGAAQHIRTDNLSADNRNIYTCVGCSSTIGISQFVTSNDSLAPSVFGLSSITDKDLLVNWTRGRNNKKEDPSTGSATGVRGYVHGDVVHSSPVAINYNRNSPTDDRDVVVFYGSNDGLFHAVKGGYADADGRELWSFIPDEFFLSLKRLYDNTPDLSSSSSKPYFFDGPTASYLLDADGDRRYDNTGKTDPAKMDKVYLYLTARRGGRLIYALDVSNPSVPKFLWKIKPEITGFGELGQTWSRPKIVKVAGRTNPVLIFGGGYDATANDAYPRGTATMGRAIFIVDAFTGELVWKAIPGDTSPGGTSAGAECVSTCSKVNGLDYSIPAAIATVDRDLNGYVDRLYAADTGGNVWRVDVGLDSTVSPAKPTFAVAKIASLGGNGVNERKFLYEPDVVLGDSIDRVQLGSGDREKPFSFSVQDMFFSIKDPGLTRNVITTPYTIDDLYDATENLVQLGTDTQKVAAQASFGTSKGWYIKLQGGLTSRDLSCGYLSGERASGKAITLNGILYFATYQPNYVYKYATTTGCTGSPAYNENICSPSLGLARVYLLNFENGSAYSEATDGLSGWALTDRYVTVGSGFLGDPTVATQRDGDGNIVDVPLFGLISDPGGLSGSLGKKVRSKVYWYEMTD